jgi:hypothetical protein
VRHYEIARVQDYIILDRRKQRGEYIDEVIGYRLDEEGQYLPLIPDEQGRVLCQSVGLWMGLQDGKVVMVDANGRAIANVTRIAAATRTNRTATDTNRTTGDRSRTTGGEVGRTLTQSRNRSRSDVTRFKN